MSINIHNYEAFVMDFLEGNLDKMKMQEMSTFLLLHPDIAMEIEDLEKIQIQPEAKIHLNNSFSEGLKKTAIKDKGIIHEENYESYFLAKLENDLNADEEILLADFLQENPSLDKEYQLVQSLSLKADENIVFQHKNSLYKKDQKVIVFWSIASSVAAILLLAFWIFQPSPIQTRERLNILASKTLKGIELENNKINLLDDKFQLEAVSVFVAAEVDPVEVRTERLPAPNKLVSSSIQAIAINENRWKNEMVLLQSYAFERTQMASQTNWEALPADQKLSAFKLISSMIWKTTKGQVKNMSQDLIQEDLKFWNSNNLEQLTGGFVSYKKAKEKE